MQFDGIMVDHAKLDQAGDDLATAARRLQGRLDTLDAELAPLKEQWSGQAQESYRRAQMAWTTAMDEMTLLLNEVSVVVRESNTAYRQADQRGADRFR